MVLLPFGERVLLDSPALSSLPGHVPTHEASAFSDSNAAASGPTSAIICTAESTPSRGTPPPAPPLPTPPPRDLLRPSPAPPKPLRSRALPPLVAPRPDAPGVGSRPPDPIA